MLGWLPDRGAQRADIRGYERRRTNAHSKRDCFSAPLLCLSRGNSNGS
jgi:hypothetical protein